MRPTAIIREAAAEGVTLALSPAGTVKAIGDQVAVDRWLPVLREHKPELLAALTQPANLDTLLVEACQDVEGIDAASFRALLSPVDIENIEGGHIPVHTLSAYASPHFSPMCRCS